MRSSKKSTTPKFKAIFWLTGTLIFSSVPAVFADVAGTVVFGELPTFFDNFMGTPISARVEQSVPAHIEGGGKLSKTKISAGTQFIYAAPSETYIAIASFNYSRENYHFSDVPAKFNSVDYLRFFTWQEYVYDHENGRSIAGMGVLGTSAADTVDLKNGSTFVLGGGLKQYFSRQDFVWLGWTISYSRLRERLYSFPAMMINWQISENLLLKASNGIELEWKFAPDWTLESKIAYDFGAFQIERHALWAQESVPLGFALRHQFHKNGYYKLGAEAILWSKFKRWQNGTRQTETAFTVDPTLNFSFELGYNF